MKKILMLTPAMDIGGAEKVVMDIVLGLKDKHLFSVASEAGYHCSQLEKNHLKHLPLPGIKGKNPLLFLKAFKHLLRILKTEKPDIVHTHHRLLSFIIGLLPYRSFIHVHTMHCSFSDKKILTQMIKPDLTVAVGEGVMKSILKNFNYPPKKCSLIRNGIRQGAYKKSHAMSVKNITCIGRLDEIKGQKYLIEAVSKLKNSHMKFTFVGDGPIKAALEEQAAQLKITEKICFVGAINDTNQILLDSDLVIVPSLSEGLPLVPLEALSCTVPVIATDIEGNREIIKHHETGILVPPRDADAIAEAIRWADNHCQEMFKYSKNGRLLVQKKFLLENMVAEYDNLYASLFYQ